MSSSSSYSDAVRELKDSLKFGIDPSLEGVRELARLFDDPHRSFDSIQIGGTNGKSSTSRYIAGILRGEGVRTGLYTSPDLVRYAERVEVDAEVVSDDVFARAILAVSEAGQQMDEPPTEFSILTVAALLMFRQLGVEAVALEVGLGGRWDATSIVDPAVSVITGIGLDHIHILGDTLEEIAGEKAGIISQGRPVVLGPCSLRPDSVYDVFVEEAGEKDAPIRTVDLRESAELEPGTFRIVHDPTALGDPLVLEVAGYEGHYAGLSALVPRYQAQNIATAIVACEAYLGRALDPDPLARSIATTPTPGRFEILRREPLMLIDASHNPQSIETFFRSLEPMIAGRTVRPSLLLAVLEDKDARGIVEAIAPSFERIHVTRTRSPRALPAADLAAIVHEVTGREPAGVHEDVASALLQVRDENVVACGSITLAGEVRGSFC